MGIFKKKQPSNTLSGFKLFFEDLSPKRRKETKKKNTYDNSSKKDTVGSNLDIQHRTFMGRFLQRRAHNDNDNLSINRGRDMKTEESAGLNRPVRKHTGRVKLGIIGIGLLLVVGSIIFSSAVILFQTNTLLTWTALSPQIAFAALIVGLAFWKILK